MNSDSIILQKVAEKDPKAAKKNVVEKDPKAAEDLKGWSYFYQLDKSLSYLNYLAR